MGAKMKKDLELRGYVLWVSLESVYLLIFPNSNPMVIWDG